MSDELQQLLARVASGELSPEAAEPLVAAATNRRPGWSEAPTDTWPAIGTGQAQTGAKPSGPTATGSGPSGSTDPAASTGAWDGPSRAVRIRVTDGRRSIVNLRIPISLASLAGAVIPGLADPHVLRLQQALRDGERGTILDVRDEDGSGVVIATE